MKKHVCAWGCALLAAGLLLTGCQNNGGTSTSAPSADAGTTTATGDKPTAAATTVATTAPRLREETEVFYDFNTCKHLTGVFESAGTPYTSRFTADAPEKGTVLEVSFLNLLTLRGSYNSSKRTYAGDFPVSVADVYVGEGYYIETERATNRPYLLWCLKPDLAEALAVPEGKTAQEYVQALAAAYLGDTSYSMSESDTSEPSFGKVYTFYRTVGDVRIPGILFKISEDGAYIGQIQFGYGWNVADEAYLAAQAWPRANDQALLQALAEETLKQNEEAIKEAEWSVTEIGNTPSYVTLADGRVAVRYEVRYLARFPQTVLSPEDSPETVVSAAEDCEVICYYYFAEK